LWALYYGALPFDPGGAWLPAHWPPPPITGTQLLIARPAATTLL
jgi:hypothetical protein